MAHWIKRARTTVLIIPDVYGNPVEYSPMQVVERFTLDQIAAMRTNLPTFDS